MKVLLIKTSSLGDVIHTLPAVTDACRHIPQIQFDWVVEEAFAEVPTWHPAVNNVIPVALRRWRKSWLKSLRSKEFRMAKAKIQQPYDLVLDAQGLIKSALLTRINKGPRYGLDRQSAREPLSSFFYQHPLRVEKDQHAIDRVRRLFALAFKYDIASDPLDFGLHSMRAMQPEKALVFFHSTTWVTKHWPESYWIELAKLAMGQQFEVWLPWGNNIEKQRAERIAVATGATVLDKLSLTQVAQTLAKATGVIGVDTGLCHLAAALDIPSVTIYGSTEPALTGTLGARQYHLKVDYACAPCLSRKCHQPKGDVFPVCYQTTPPEKVWQMFLHKTLRNL